MMMAGLLYAMITLDDIDVDRQEVEEDLMALGKSRDASIRSVLSRHFKGVQVGCL